MEICELHEDRNCDEEATMFTFFGHYSAPKYGIISLHSRNTCQAKNINKNELKTQNEPIQIISE